MPAMAIPTATHSLAGDRRAAREKHRCFGDFIGCSKPAKRRSGRNHFPALLALTLPEVASEFIFRQ
jgi:hypothetical protein